MKIRRVVFFTLLTLESTVHFSKENVFDLKLALGYPIKVYILNCRKSRKNWLDGDFLTVNSVKL